MDPKYRMYADRELAYPCRAGPDRGYGYHHIKGMETGKGKECPAPIRERRV